jgi:integrase
MTRPDKNKRRARGDGGLHWDDERKRWIATVTIGYTPAGKRIVRKASDKSKTKALAKLREKVRDRDDGLPIEPGNYTVADAVRNWLEYGLTGRELRSILKRSVARAQARDKVKRNVVLLCELPKGRPGRPSKSLTLDQAVAVLDAAETAKPWLCAYITLSLLTGARTEELRGLIWAHLVAFDRDTAAWLPVSEAAWDHDEFAIYVWRSVRRTGDTKTAKSRRTLKLPQRCVAALRALWERQAVARQAAGDRWEDNDLVFATRTGTGLSAGNVRREFRRVIVKAGLVGPEWTPREMRHSFVSLLSDSGVPIEQISRLVGHAGTTVTEQVYRKQIRPVIEDGAVVMDRIFPDDGSEA